MKRKFIKNLIKGYVKYSDWEIVGNAVVIIYIRYQNEYNKWIKEEVGYTVTNEFGEFCFVLNQYNYKDLEYIIEVFEPLN